MKHIELFPIGFIHTPFETKAPHMPGLSNNNSDEFWIELDKKYIPSLDGKEVGVFAS